MMEYEWNSCAYKKKAWKPNRPCQNSLIKCVGVKKRDFHIFTRQLVLLQCSTTTLMGAYRGRKIRELWLDVGALLLTASLLQLRRRSHDLTSSLSKKALYLMILIIIIIFCCSVCCFNLFSSSASSYSFWPVKDPWFHVWSRTTADEAGLCPAKLASTSTWGASTTWALPRTSFSS